MTDCRIHPTCVVDDHVTIGSGTRIWHFSHIQSGAVIGSDCSFGQNVYIASRVRIGNGVRIHHVTIGSGTRIWHFSHIQSGAVIGSDCSFGQNVYIASRVRIGNGVRIQNNVSVYEGVELEDHVFCGPSCVFTNVLTPRSRYPRGSAAYARTLVKEGASIGYEGVELEDHVFCGPSCVFTNVLTPRSRYPRGSAAYARTLVKEGASIGANATVLCGHTIGRHALIAAGAVVTCDVGDHALMSGIPARQTGWVCECGTILPDTLRCPERHALIAAGAVVTCDVGDHALMSGIPARQTGWVCECGTILPDTLRCPECGRQYQPAGTGLKEVQP